MKIATTSLHEAKTIRGLYGGVDGLGAQQVFHQTFRPDVAKAPHEVAAREVRGYFEDVSAGVKLVEDDQSVRRVAFEEEADATPGATSSSPDTTGKNAQR